MGLTWPSKLIKEDKIQFDSLDQDSLSKASTLIKFIKNVFFPGNYIRCLIQGFDQVGTEKGSSKTKDTTLIKTLSRYKLKKGNKINFYSI